MIDNLSNAQTYRAEDGYGLHVSEPVAGILLVKPPAVVPNDPGVLERVLVIHVHGQRGSI